MRVVWLLRGRYGQIEIIMRFQRAIDLIHAFLLFLAGLGVGIGVTVLIQHFWAPKVTMPLSCSDYGVIQYVNENTLSHFVDEYAEQNDVNDVALYVPLSDSHVRTLGISEFGNDCYGTITISFFKAIQKTRDELPALVLTDEGIWVDSEGDEYTEWYKWVQYSREVPVTYETYLSDSGDPWTSILSFETPSNMDFSKLLFGL